MSFALVHKNKNKEADSKTSTSARPSPHHHINNLAMTPHDYIIHLQRTIGNQAVQRLMRSNIRFNFANIPIKPKLKISQPGDAYEQEADRLAEQVMRMSDSDSITSVVPNKEEGINRRCAACEMNEDAEEQELNISLKQSTPSNLETTDETAKEISDVRSSGGSSLDNNTKEFMESRFGYALSRVRIHTDAKAAESANSINASAYTIGNDVVFGEGQYQPNTLEGRGLLAHELAHVVQQSTSDAKLQRQPSPPATEQKGKPDTPFVKCDSNSCQNARAYINVQITNLTKLHDRTSFVMNQAVHAFNDLASKVGEEEAKEDLIPFTTIVSLFPTAEYFIKGVETFEKFIKMTGEAKKLVKATQPEPHPEEFSVKELDSVTKFTLNGDSRITAINKKAMEFLDKNKNDPKVFEKVKADLPPVREINPSMEKDLLDYKNDFELELFRVYYSHHASIFYKKCSGIITDSEPKHISEAVAKRILLLNMLTKHPYRSKFSRPADFVVGDPLEMVVPILENWGVYSFSFEWCNPPGPAMHQP